MPTTYDRVDFAPPQPKGSGKSFALAVIAHLLLIAALTWGVNWHAEDNSGVSAELWSSVPQEAAPKLVTPDPTPPQPTPTPEPKVDPKPPPPEPKVDPAPNRDAEIAMEQEKKKRELQKQEEARIQQAKIEKAKQDKAREDQAKAEKAKQDKLKADQLKAEQAKQDAEDKKKELAKKAADEKKAAAAQEAERQKNIARMTGLAGATGGENSKGAALQSSGPSSSYGGKVRARVKPNVVFTEDIDGNPTAEVEVRTSPDGTIVSQKLVKSSGSKSWDDAVIKAIIKTGTLPRDVDGRVPSSLVIAFRPKD